MNTAPRQTEAQRLADACDAEQVATVKRDILMHDVAALLRRQDELLGQTLETLSYWLEHGETPRAHDMIQRTHAVLQERLK